MAGDGTASGFDAAQFRSAISAAMIMGAPIEPQNQVHFIFSEAATYAPQDPGRNPYAWDETTATDVAEREVVVPCAVQYATSTTVTGTPMGDFDASRAVLTVLDTDYGAVAGANMVRVGDNMYLIDPPGWIPLGLFSVGVYQLHVSARS